LIEMIVPVMRSQVARLEKSDKQPTECTNDNGEVRFHSTRLAAHI